MAKISAEEFLARLNTLNESSSIKTNRIKESLNDPYEALRTIATYGGDSSTYSNIELIGSVLDNSSLSQIDYDSAIGALENISELSEDNDFLNAISVIRSALEDKLVDNVDFETGGPIIQTSIFRIKSDIDFLRMRDPTKDEFVALNIIEDALDSYEQTGTLDSSELEDAFYILEAGKNGSDIDERIDSLISGIKELNSAYEEEFALEESTNRSLKEAEDSKTIIYYIPPRLRYEQNNISDRVFDQTFDDNVLYNSYYSPVQHLDKEIKDAVADDMKEMGPTGLAKYLSKEYDKELYGKVKSIKLEYDISKKNRPEGLYVTCELASGINPYQVDEKLKDYIEGQMSDGWGEGFEQHGFSCGTIYAVYDVNNEFDIEYFANERDADYSYRSKDKDEQDYQSDDEDYEPREFDWSSVDVEVYCSFWERGHCIEATYIDGRDTDGFDLDGYGKDGFDRFNRDREGYDRSGFNTLGFNREGFDKEGFNEEGFDKEGYGRDGLDKNGYDRSRRATIKNFLKVNPLQDLNHGYDYYKK